jgi:hypothetical protein
MERERRAAYVTGASAAGCCPRGLPSSNGSSSNRTCVCGGSARARQSESSRKVERGMPLVLYRPCRATGFTRAPIAAAAHLIPSRGLWLRTTRLLAPGNSGRPREPDPAPASWALPREWLQFTQHGTSISIGRIWIRGYSIFFQKKNSDKSGNVSLFFNIKYINRN